MISLKSLKRILIYAMVIFLSWGCFQIKGLYFYWIFLVLYCVIDFVDHDLQLYFAEGLWVNAVYICLFFSGVACLFSDIPNSFKGYAIVMTVFLAPMYFAFTFLKQDLYKKELEVCELTNALKIGIMIQLLYMPMQLICWRFLHADLNDLFFHRLTHMMESPSFHRLSDVIPSGFTWHSAYIAPMLVFAALLFNKPFQRALILFDAFICGNTTALVGVVLALVLVLVFQFLQATEEGIKRRICVEFFILIVIMTAAFAATDLFSKISEKISYVITRFSVEDTDISSKIHVSYYLLYPKIIKNSSIASLLFGTGYGTSGYAISKINGQYSSLAHWVVETDYIDMLVSRGIVGFLSYYCFLFVIAIKGFKINPKYAIAVFVFCIQGVTYNIQFEYTFFLELLLVVTIELGVDLFGDNHSNGVPMPFSTVNEDKKWMI